MIPIALVAAVAFLMAQVSTTTSWLIPPQSLADGRPLFEHPPPCREATVAERYDLGMGPEGKAATFQLGGVYICQRELFEYEERDPYVQFISRHIHSLARMEALRLAQSERTSKTESSLWSVKVGGARADMHPYLRQVFLTELASALGPGRVKRTKPNKRDDRQLHVRVRSVDDPKLLLVVTTRAASGSRYQ